MLSYGSLFNNYDFSIPSLFCMYLVIVFWDIANTLKDASFYNANPTFLFLLYAKRFSGENCAKGKKSDT